jgi:hypothetical protein
MKDENNIARFKQRLELRHGHRPARRDGFDELGVRPLDPVVQSFAAESEWIIGILVGSGSVAVQGYREVVDAGLRHGLIPSLWARAGNLEQRP